MSIQRFLLATVASMLVMVTLWWLWHGSFMAGFYAQHRALPREIPLWRIVLLGYLLLAVIMCVIYPKGYAGSSPLLEGLRFGVLVGVVFALSRGLVLYGLEGSHTGTLVIVDAAWHMVEQGAGGIVIACVHGRLPGLPPWPEKA